MKRTIEEERRPVSLKVYADTEEVRQGILEATKVLSSKGYDEDLIYQAGFAVPPVDKAAEIVDKAAESCVYVNVTGTEEDVFPDRRMEQFQPGYSIENQDVFNETVRNIEAAVEDLEYHIEYWHVGSVSTNARSEDTVEALNGMEVNATAQMDAGLETQRIAGFQGIGIGWFRKASMSNDTQFGYRAFPDREFKHHTDETYDILGCITGQREDEINNHDLSKPEIEVLMNLEEEMNRKGLL